MTAGNAKPAERLKLSAGIAWLLALMAAGAASAQVHAYGLAAKVNGVGISNETLERNFQEYLRENNVNLAAVRNPERVKGMRRQALDLLIDQELAWQAAQNEKILASMAEVEEAVRALRDQFKSGQAFADRLAIEGYTGESYREHLRRLVSARKYLDRIAGKAAGVGDDEVHAFHAANPDKFALPERVRARHILVRADPAAGEEGRRAAREKIAGILDNVRSGGDFAELAVKYSEDAGAGQGGDLGEFSRGRMVKPFEDAAFALEAGAVSDPVETAFGLHIIKVEGRVPRSVVPVDAAREQIRSFLQRAKGRDAVQAELLRLRSAAKIEVLLPLQ